jgi:hypothetical protein
VAGGFLSVHPILGLSAEPAASQGGYRSPHQVLGISSEPATGQGGFRTPVPGWNAGGTTAVQGGYKSLLGFWMGGASAGEAIVLPTEEKLGGPRDDVALRERIRAEDEEILMFIAAWTEMQ